MPSLRDEFQRIFGALAYEEPPLTPDRYRGIEMDRLARIIIPIVEGQIGSFLKDHPEMAACYAVKVLRGKTKAQMLTDSIAKRISRQLLCSQVRGWLTSALGATNESPEPVTGELTPPQR